MSNGKQPIKIDVSDMDPNASAAEAGFDTSLPSAFAPNSDFKGAYRPGTSNKTNEGPTLH